MSRETTTDARVFHAAEFDYLAPAIRNQLELVTTTTPAFVLEPRQPFLVESEESRAAASTLITGTGSRELAPFFSNKKRIQGYFLKKLSEIYIKDHNVGPYDASSVRTAIAAFELSSGAASSGFVIEKIHGSEFYKVITTLSRGTTTISDAARELASTGKIQVTGGSGNSYFVVNESMLNGIYNSLQATIVSQQAMRAVVSRSPVITAKKAELRVDEHEYPAIYSGDKGVAYYGKGVGGFIGSALYSLFETKPQNNLEKVVRLLRNYLNQMKSLTRHNFSDIETLIKGLETEIAPYYKDKGLTSEAIDGLIVGRLATYFDKWSSPGHASVGSAMRRLVFAMNEILPGIKSSLDSLSVPASSGTAAAYTGAGAGGSATGVNPHAYRK